LTIDLDTLTLARGSHGDRDQGICLMEAVAWFAGRPHSDKPPCVSPVLGAYGRSLNDVLPDIPRQELKQFIPQLPGTAGDGKDATRGYIALDWLIRTYTPAWLDLAGLTAEAAALRDFRRIADLATARAVRPRVLAARGNAAAAWAAAWDAAGDAAGAAAWAAAWDVAWAAAGHAARDAAWHAARDAARDAAGAAAGAAAWDAARDAAGDAAGHAAWAAARHAARDAARAAARDALKPTVEQLRQSAISLYTVLIAGEWPQP